MADTAMTLCYPSTMRNLLILASLVSGTALADESAVTPKQSALYQPMDGVDYFCTDDEGHRAELGRVFCFSAGCRVWTARCEMSSDNNFAMWRELNEGCPAM